MANPITVTEGQKTQTMGGAHEAASRISRELATWLPVVRSPDADNLMEKGLLDARAIDLSRNDAYVSAGIALHRDNVVGSQFRLNLKPNLRILGQDEEWAADFQEEVEAYFEDYAENLRNWIDASGRNSFTAFIRLLVGVYLHSGECLVTSEWLNRGRDKARPYYTSFQAIELSRLCNPMDQSFNQDRVRGGIEYDVHGKPIAFYIRRSALGDRLYGPDAYKWSRIRSENSIGRPQVFHVLEQQRPGQGRGVSQLVSAMKEMRVLKRFRDLELQKAALHASFFASIESELPTQTLHEAMGGKSSADVQHMFEEFGTGYLAAISEYANDGSSFQVDGVRIPHFFPGTKLQFNTASSPDGVGSEFEASLLRYIAANLDVSYEELSRDYQKSSYSSARAGMLQTWKASQSRKRMIADRAANFILRNWFEEALNQGRFETMNRQRMPNFYEFENAYLKCSWIGGIRGQIDEEKETKAAVLRIRAGLSTWEDELARHGKDWREVFAQRAREQDLLDDLGIDLPELESMMTASEDEPPEGGQTEESANG